ncbi:hypothetical protein Bcav_2656 [Beutenbergia cavernae DSM 12333]|uniref:Uncharacterized protein n=1 Tax=Beutenbergia cavernae (strain ATCC BAA-8 / DSM 12333 / CCUG 43141 / JCM 11478 / NBRC 16432 / NCIMB 13614 / HKI 0122) TaxID=471853 RepID=C5BXL8_BEUC1|nr:hypothetical protein Bcav_2656 [Beutenbergia cavernae DSM 12333]
MPWASEADRWAELVFCVTNAFVDDPVQCRQLTESLRDLQLVSPSALMGAKDTPTPAHAVIRHVLGQHGIGKEQTERIIQTLADMASAVMNGYEGKIQRFLRAEAESIRDDLTTLLAGPRTPSSELRRGITHWLQNAAGLPISVEDESVRQFCANRGITVQQLQQAADEVDFNLALVDDLIRLEKAEP